MQRTHHAPQKNSQAPPVANPPNRPVKTFSCPAGNGVYIKAAVWAKDMQENGRTFKVYSASVQKAYPKQGGGYENTSFFRGSELQIVLHCLEMAEEWILSVRTVEDPVD